MERNVHRLNRNLYVCSAFQKNYGTITAVDCYVDVPHILGMRFHHFAYDSIGKLRFLCLLTSAYFCRKSVYIVLLSLLFQ